MRDYAGRRVLVAGAGVAGAASARALLRRGARVTVLDRVDGAGLAELAGEGARVVVADEPLPGLLDSVTDVVLSPGFAPRHPVAAAAVAAGLDVYSEPELAWRLRGPDAPPWLAVTGTNGKTTTTTMLAAILTAAGLRTAALGNIGEPLVFAATGEPPRISAATGEPSRISAATGEPPGISAATGEPPRISAATGEGSYDVLAVELSSFQLHWSRWLAPQAGALLNLADDHLDWHGGFEAYAESKTRIWRAATPESGGVAVVNLDDPRAAAAMSIVEGRTVGFTLAEPGPGQLGIVGGALVDRTGSDPVELAPADLVRPSGAHNVANALAAAALARAYGVGPDAVLAGLSAYVPQGHRNAYVATISGVVYVDDSKATNPHAAYASLTAYPRVVWIAGGQLKGVDVDGLVGGIAGRLAGVVLLGVDRHLLAAALARHAPWVPVVESTGTDDGAMGEVVSAAAALARPGDTVLLAPAAASLDMFASYAARGQAFANAVRALGVDREAGLRETP